MSVDAVAQAELVRTREITALELVEAAIASIEAVNPNLNAVVTPMYEVELDRARAPLPESPLAGVPILLKDYIASYEGVRQRIVDQGARLRRPRRARSRPAGGRRPGRRAGRKDRQPPAQHSAEKVGNTPPDAGA